MLPHLRSNQASLRHLHKPMPKLVAEPTFNERVARRLGITSNEVQHALDRWANDQIMQTVLKQRIDDKLKLVRVQLETCKPADLQTLQGQVAELKACIALVGKTD